jgi:hypothetical protein
MTTKLTLVIDKDILEKAKLYAKSSGRSLSELIVAHLESLIQENKTEHKISPKLKGLIGSVKLTGDFDKRKELGSYFKKKYL